MLTRLRQHLLIRKIQRQPTRDERQARRVHWHGALIILWGVWVVLFGARNFTTPTFEAFGHLPHWAWGGLAIILGLAIYLLASNARAMAITLPGILAAFAWFAIAALILIGDFRSNGVPIYAGLAWNAYAFLVRE